MIRDKKIEVRLTREELEYLKYISNDTSVSNYIKQLIKGDSCCAEKRQIARHIYNMQTYLNEGYHIGITPEIISKLETEMNQLWQFLN